MKIYKTQEEVNADIVDGVLSIKGDVRFEFSLKIQASINVEAGNIDAWDINAAGNINIDAWGNINAAGNINAGGNIEARGNIDAGNVLFYAVCFAYISFVCKSVKGRRNNSKYFCLDSDVQIKSE